MDAYERILKLHMGNFFLPTSPALCALARTLGVFGRTGVHKGGKAQRGEGTQLTAPTLLCWIQLTFLLQLPSHNLCHRHTPILAAGKNPHFSISNRPLLKTHTFFTLYSVWVWACISSWKSNIMLICRAVPLSKERKKVLQWTRIDVLKCVGLWIPLNAEKSLKAWEIFCVWVITIDIRNIAK